MFDNGLKRTIKNAFNGNSLDYVNEEWDYMKSRDEKYLDDVNENYQLSSLDRMFAKEAQAYAGNLSAQKKINEARQTELDALKEKDKLSQADFDRAEAKLKVLQAELALEEARNSAVEMQLTRDASGNYSYTFVASEDRIAEAEERLAEANNALYNLDKDRVIQLQDEYLALWTEFDSEIKEAMNISDAQEREARIAQIKAQYKEQFAGLKTEFNEIIAASGESVGSLVNSSILAAMNSDIFADGGEIDTLIQNRLDDAETISDILYGEDGESGVISAIGDAKGSIDSLTPILEKVETSVADIAILLPALITALGGEVPQYDSGGYTGEWGSSGKLAMLHEKELVLNAADTENILAAVSVVRAIGQSIGNLSAEYAQNTGVSIPAQEIINLFKDIVHETAGSLEQQVHIEANFPNVTDRNEIQEAINNLISLAEQKANER
jgi:hypothetical protein